MKSPLDDKNFWAIDGWTLFALPLIGVLNAAAKWTEASERVQGIVEGLFIGYVLALIMFNLHLSRLQGRR